MSIDDGLYVMLCHDSCHQYGPYSAHQCRETDLMLKRVGQNYAMIKHGWTLEQFIARYEQNYLDESGLDIWPEEALCSM